MRHLGILLIALACACKNDEGPAAAFDGEAALRYAGTQVSFGPRVPGSQGWEQGGAWIVEQMRQRADTVIEQRWWHHLVSGDSIPMRNIIARFNPKAADRILYVTHWDTRPIADSESDTAKRRLPIPGANDGASGVGLFVALGDLLKQQRPTVGVDLLFVDGEDYGDFGVGKDVLIGSRYFAKNLPDANYQPLFGVLWDMIGDKDLKIYQEQYSLQRAPEVVTRVWQMASKQGLSKVFVPEGKYAVTDDHIPLLDAGLRVIDVIDLDYPDHHRLSDTMDKISAKSLGQVGRVAAALLYTTD